jgi:3-oxoacyl-[acyl-carrier protein] reductase
MTRALTGKTAVVTGTAHGIGAAIAGALRGDGAAVHGVDKDTADLTTAILCTRAVVPAMKERRWGRIINISSMAGLGVSKTGIQAYASAKAAQIGFTRQMAHELGPFGITVNCIAPGFILSNPTTERQWDSYGAEGQRDLVRPCSSRSQAPTRSCTPMGSLWPMTASRFRALGVPGPVAWLLWLLVVIIVVIVLALPGTGP